MTPKSVHQMWEECKAKVYPGRLSEIQEAETKQAFYAGIFSIMGYMHDEIAQLSDEAGAVALELVNHDVRKILGGFMAKHSSKQN